MRLSFRTPSVLQGSSGAVSLQWDLLACQQKACETLHCPSALHPAGEPCMYKGALAMRESTSGSDMGRPAHVNAKSWSAVTRRPYY